MIRLLTTLAVGAAAAGYYLGRRYAVKRLWMDRTEWTEPFRDAVRERDRLQRENQELQAMATELQVELNAYRKEAEERLWN
jgi:coproporphyrinogen III oxidase-like Fe-S oxidoreductase